MIILQLSKEKEIRDNRIGNYHKPLGLSQHRLGKKVGILRTSINKIETGETIPRLNVSNYIANALGVCMYKIFDLDGKETYKCNSRNCC